MASKMSAFFNLLINPKTIKILLSLDYNGYLKEWNWINSVKNRQAIGKNDEAIPWFTYPSIEFLKDRLNKNLSVLEYGSGNSSIWFADRVGTITSIEHDKKWFNKIKSVLPNNAKIILNNPLNKLEYHQIIKTLPNKYNIIVVDAIDRVNCLKTAVEYLTENGVIILDNSNREEYLEGINFLLEKNFRKIDFWGMTPGVNTNWATTVFYRSKNCLNI